MNIAEAGRYSLTLTTPQVAEERHNIITTGFRAAIMEHADEHVSTIGALYHMTASFESLFICPPLYARPPGQDGFPVMAAGSVPLAVSPSAVVGEPNDYIIIGQPESGKTCLALHIALLFTDCASEYMPCILDFKAIKPYLRSLRKACASVYGGLTEQAELDNSLRTGRCVFIADNFDCREASHVRAVKIASAEWSECRWIFFTSHAPDEGALAAIASSRRPLKQLFIGPLTRNNIRILVERWCSTLGLQAADVLAYVLQWLTRQRLPRTAFVVYLLLTAMQQNRMFNEGVLLETVIEMLLKKGVSNQGLRAEFDFRARQVLLSSMAWDMRKAGDVDYNWCLTYVLQFIQEKGFSFNASEIMESILRSRVLSRDSEQRVRFRFPSFQAYFVALHLRDKRDTVLKSLDAGFCAAYAREIDLLSALDRTDEPLLDRIHSILVAENPERFQAADMSGTLSVLHKSSGVALLESEPLAPRPTRPDPEELDEALDLMEQELKAQTTDGLALEIIAERGWDARDVRFEQVLDLYGRVIRNTEFAAAQVKLKHAGAYFQGYSGIWLRVMADWPMIIDRVFVGLEKRGARVTDDKKNEIAGVMHKVMPILLARWVFAAAGTDKLKRVFAAVSEEKEINEVARFLAVCSVLQLAGGGLEKCLKAFFDEEGHSRYLKLVLLEMIKVMYMVRDLNDEEALGFENIIGDMEVRLGFKVRGEVKGERKGRIIQTARDKKAALGSKADSAIIL